MRSPLVVSAMLFLCSEEATLKVGGGYPLNF
jgi:hypothetical protein